MLKNILGEWVMVCKVDILECHIQDGRYHFVCNSRIVWSMCEEEEYMADNWGCHILDDKCHL